MRLLARAVGCLIMAVLAMTLGLAGSTLAAEGSGFGIQPISGGDWFTFAVVPGETVEGTALAINRRSEPLDVLVYPADGFTTPQGGFALQERDETPEGVGQWVTSDTDRLRLEPGERAEIPFRMAVPETVEPGDHAGGLILEAAPREGGSQNVDEEMEVQLDVIERVGVRLYVTVEGEKNLNLEAGELTWEHGPDGIELTLPVANTGNVRAPLSGTIDIEGWPSDDEQLSIKTSGDDLLPGSETTLTAVWEAPPSVFLGHATASVDYGAEEPLERDVSLRLVPTALLLGLLAGLLTLGLVGWRIVRFLRRAREALRRVQGLESAEEPEPTSAAAGTRDETPVSIVSRR